MSLLTRGTRLSVCLSGMWSNDLDLVMLTGVFNVGRQNTPNVVLRATHKVLFGDQTMRQYQKRRLTIKKVFLSARLAHAANDDHRLPPTLHPQFTNQYASGYADNMLYTIRNIRYYDILFVCLSVCLFVWIVICLRDE